MLRSLLSTTVFAFAGLTGVAGLLAANAARADASVYKCVDPQGGVAYQQDPCEAGTRGGRLAAEVSVPTLLQIRPSDRSVDQCLRLHDYTRNAPDFQLRSSAFVPVGDGSYQLALTGSVPAASGAGGRATVRCPVTGDGSVNLELWRVQRGLANVQRSASAITGTPAVESPSAGTSDSGRLSAGASGAAPNRRPLIGNAERAGERRFIEGTINSETMRTNDVRERLGDPDNQGSASGDCIPLPGGYGTSPCRYLTWVYEPTTLDPQTRTTIEFSDAGEAVRVTREIVR